MNVRSQALLKEEEGGEGESQEEVRVGGVLQSECQEETGKWWRCWEATAAAAAGATA